jgi:hypothetical protein
MGGGPYPYFKVIKTKDSVPAVLKAGLWPVSPYNLYTLYVPFFAEKKEPKKPPEKNYIPFSV